MLFGHSSVASTFTYTTKMASLDPITIMDDDDVAAAEENKVINEVSFLAIALCVPEPYS